MEVYFCKNALAVFFAYHGKHPRDTGLLYASYMGVGKGGQGPPGF